MHYYACVQVQGFYVGVISQCKGGAGATGMAVHRDKKVIDCDRAARERGVTPGMGLGEAKMLLGPEAVVAWREEDYRSAQERWLDVCARFTCVIEPRSQHEALLDLSSHANPYEAALALREAVAVRVGHEVWVGMAAAPWIARLACESAGGLSDPASWTRTMHLGVEEPARFLSGLGVGCLEPVRPEDRQRLEFLGYRTVDEVAALPLSVLKRQFGDRAWTIACAARGGCARRVRAEYPRDSLRASFHFEGGAKTQERVEAGLRVLARRLGAALTLREASAHRVEARLLFASGSRVDLRRSVAKPISNARGAYAALTLLVQPALATAPRSPRSEIASIHVRLPNLTHVARAQAELSGFYAESARKETAASALLALRNKFGDDSVRLAGELSPPRRARVLSAWSQATGWR